MTNLEELQFTKEGRPCRINGRLYVPLEEYDWWTKEKDTLTLWSIDGHEGSYRHTKHGYVQLHAGADMKKGETQYVFHWDER